MNRRVQTRGSLASPCAAQQVARRPGLPAELISISPNEDIESFIQMAKYRIFAAGVIEHGNLTKASIAAGLISRGSTRDAQRMLAMRLVKLPLVAALVREYYDLAILKSGATVERIWAELARIAFADLGDCSDAAGVRALHEIPTDTRRALQSYKVKRTVVAGEDGDIVTEEREVMMLSKPEAIAQLMKLRNIGQAARAPEVVTPEQLLQAMEEGRRRALERPQSDRNLPTGIA